MFDMPITAANSSVTSADLGSVNVILVIGIEDRTGTPMAGTIAGYRPRGCYPQKWDQSFAEGFAPTGNYPTDYPGDFAPSALVQGF